MKQFIKILLSLIVLIILVYLSRFAAQSFVMDNILNNGSNDKGCIS